MTTSATGPARVTHIARLEGGPRHGAVRPVAARPSGEPPDFLHVGEHAEGVYALAGARRADGTLPYWWMSWARVNRPD